MGIGKLVARSSMVLLALSVILATGASASPLAPTGSNGLTTFTDPAGDAQGGPDVTRVVISGDAATGAIELTVTAQGLEPAVSDGRERDAIVWLDTDENRSTGDPEDGTDYALEAWNDASGRWWNMIRWNGVAWESVPQSATMRVTGQGDSVTYALATADLGGSTSFRFYVIAGTWNTATESFDTRDEAPDLGWWTYDITSSTATTPPATKVGLLVRSPHTTPKTPVAGKRFTVRYGVQFQKTKTVHSIDLASGQTLTSLVVSWEPVKAGAMTCKATVAGRSLARCGGFKGGTAAVSFVVPKTAAGKTLRLEVKFTATDAETGKKLTATRVTTYRVK